MKEAMFYAQLMDNRVHCYLCAHHCRIAQGQRGICQMRENQGGTLYSLVYGQVISQHVDPVEKKPLFHFYPGSTAYSIATPGCNFHCTWCQNWEISQVPSEQNFIATNDEVNPEQLVTDAQYYGCRSIAYTYTEPTIGFEYVYDIARLARGAGVANIFVTNGYMTGEMLEVIHPYLDAANVDLKAFRDRTYQKYIGSRLQPVLDSLKTIKQLGIWLEVTTLVIPGINDDPAELRDVAQFIVRELGADTPWHVSRFFPNYQLTKLPLTPPETLHRAREIGLAQGLKYVYIGNLAADDSQHTACPNCGAVLIGRSLCRVLFNRIQNGCCPDCGYAIAGVEIQGDSLPTYTF